MRTAKPLLALATAWLLLLVFLCSKALISQDSPGSLEPGAAIYREAANAVLWIEVLDASGSVVATGSGFLTEAGHVVTSAHVVASGTPRVRLGPVALNARVERLDLKQDLATLAIEGELALAGLPLAQQSPAPGTSVWVIGNPQGLERTITSGTTSGTRTEDGVSYLQLSAPVSPGSSGGPVLTADGKVVGLVRMTLQTGQNLNFAVPIESIRAFLAGDVAQRSVETFQEAIRQLAEEDGLSFASEASSDSRGCDLARTAISMAGNDKERWLQATSIAWEHFRVIDCLDEHLSWARKTYRMFGTGHEPSFDVYSAALMAAGRRADAGTPERFALWREALTAFQQENKVRPRSSWSFWADWTESAAHVEGEGSTVEEALKKAVAYCEQIALPSDPAKSRESEGAKCRRRIGILGFDHFLSTGDLDEAQKALRVATDVRDWGRFFTMLEEKWLALHFKFFEADRFVDASSAAEMAAVLWTELNVLEPAFDAKCRAAISAAFAGEDNAVLQRGRECIDLSSKVKSPNTKFLGIVHTDLAQVLQERGVPDQALVHTQQALALLDAEKDRVWLGAVFKVRASALLALDRPSESLAASKEALRLTDGIDEAVHFTAGAAAFKLRDFTAAERYFRKASELEPDDAASVFNVALCLENQGFRGDAAVWFRRYLKLEPDAEKRRRVERKLSEWGL